LICIEEPELGLHPDILPSLGKLLIQASQKSQLVVTTQSDILVGSLSEQPESVVVVERDEEGTHLERLDKAKLEPFLDEYRLGELWIKGELGGTRW
jgi:predicted ATPase